MLTAISREAITRDADMLLVWCHQNNAVVRFKNPNNLELKIPGIRRIYAYSLYDAVRKARELLSLKERK